MQAARPVLRGPWRGNAPGLPDDFYSRLIDQLLENGIAPFVTLYHWDLPQYLQDDGGWTNRATAERFADYAVVVGEALGDRAATVTTLNEPWCAAYLGHATGVHAPGHRNNAEALSAAHHLNLAHGLGVRALRSVLPPSTKVSVTLNLAQIRSASDSPADTDAVRHVDALSNRIFLEPMLEGRYPNDLLADMRQVTDWAFIHDGDTEIISSPIDVLGINYYSPVLVAAATPSLLGLADDALDPNSASSPVRYPGTDLAMALPQDGPYTAMGWRVEPASLTELLLRVHRDYPQLPLMITENGAAFDDDVDGDGAVHDANRIDYLTGHIAAVHDAIAAGVDVRGYFLWSLLDNFEWAHGYSKRFGIVRVDFASGERLVKDSAYWYRDLTSAQAVR